jgi:hypothetical protein
MSPTSADGCSLSVNTLTVIPEIYHICTVTFDKFTIHSANDMQAEEEILARVSLHTSKKNYKSIRGMSRT